MRFYRPKGLIYVTKWVTAGISAAGVINTIAPGLFPTTMGYIAGSLRGTDFSAWMVKAGLFSLGAFSTPTISNLGILAVGAAAGLVIGLILLPAYYALLRRGKYAPLPPDKMPPVRRPSIPENSPYPADRFIHRIIRKFRRNKP